MWEGCKSFEVCGQKETSLYKRDLFTADGKTTTLLGIQVYHAPNLKLTKACFTHTTVTGVILLLHRCVGTLCSKDGTHLHSAKQCALQKKKITATNNRAGENPGYLLCLPCSEKAANSTAVSNGHSSLKIQTYKSQSQQK